MVTCIPRYWKISSILNLFCIIRLHQIVMTRLHSRVYMRRGVIDDKWLHGWLSSLPPSSPPPPQ